MIDVFERDNLEQAHKMQTEITSRLLFSLFFGVSLLAPHKGLCQATQAAKGLSVDGICAEIRVNYSTNESQSPEITVAAVDSKSDTLFGEGHLGTNWIGTFRQHALHRSWPYYEATNSFCGPFELEDSAGQKIPLVDARLSSPQAYPETYSLMEEWGRHFSTNPPRGHMGAMEFPLALIRSVSDLAKFQLKDEFEIKQPGRYELTVWPKIYKRSATNSDLCNRVDLPPVSISISLK